jgi:hypothetical protein
VGRGHREAADHQLDDRVACDGLGVDGGRDAAIAEDGDVIAKTGDFVEPVRDVQRRPAVLRETEATHSTSRSTCRASRAAVAHRG